MQDFPKKNLPSGSFDTPGDKEFRNRAKLGEISTSPHRRGHTPACTHIFARSLLLYITFEVSGDTLRAWAGNKKMLRTHDGKESILIEVIPSRGAQLLSSYRMVDKVGMVVVVIYYKTFYDPSVWPFTVLRRQLAAGQCDLALYSLNTWLHMCLYKGRSERAKREEEGKCKYLVHLCIVASAIQAEEGYNYRPGSRAAQFSLV